jgi:uncharacterized protein YukE
MKKVTLLFLFAALLSSWNTAQAQIADGHEALKKHINSIAEKVDETEAPSAKREILNESLQDMITAIDRVSNNKSVSTADGHNLDAFKSLLSERKDELNGADGYTKVSDSELDNYAKFIQQKAEQADTVLTLSATTALLIVIILLLL